jgi:hypothetical protein
LNTASLPFLFQEDLYLVPQKTLVVLARNWDEYSSDDKILLTRILGSVKQSLSSVQVIVQSTLSPELISGYNPSKVLVFGSVTTGINPYESHQIQGFDLIKADDLPLLDDLKKKSLWACLKNMFSL